MMKPLRLKYIKNVMRLRNFIIIFPQQQHIQVVFGIAIPIYWQEITKNMNNDIAKSVQKEKYRNIFNKTKAFKEIFWLTLDN